MSRGGSEAVSPPCGGQRLAIWMQGIGMKKKATVEKLF
jgi:hypothetical protein